MLKMNERPHPTAEDFLRYCDEQVAKALFLASALRGNSGSYAAAMVQADVWLARIDGDRRRIEGRR